jgi:GTP-binding protein
MLYDEAVIQVRSGDGGNGCVSFRREAYAPKGGPDGGDGGRGGDVVLVGSQHLNTLTRYTRQRHWKAQSGEQGGARQCSGKGGQDVVLELPLGTLVRHAETGEILADVTQADQRIVLAAGGKGGKGNIHFKSPINQVPRQSTPGEPGIVLPLKLELKMIADIGIIGFPNAGKSTLLSRLSAARPKIGPYPFTTLDPQLGVIERNDRTVILADIPGLIEGAAEGAGLGHRFLRHVERCHLLLHLVDGSEGDVDALAERVRILDGELARFSPHLAVKPQLVALNKVDVRPDLGELVAPLAERLGREVRLLSGVSGMGLKELEDELLRRTDAPALP